MRPARERNFSWQRFLNSNNCILDPQDKISRLPEDVIHHITSFLPSEDIDQLRLVSRKWQRIYLQSQNVLQLSRCRLDEQQLWAIFQEYFPNADILKLEHCSGITNLNVVNNKLRHVTLFKCANLEKVKLTAPALEVFRFTGSIHKPCAVELRATTNLTQLHLRGAQVDETTFSDCDSKFPVLTDMSLGGSHDMPDSINISSSSLKTVYFCELKKRVDITMHAPELDYVWYQGDLFANFSTTNLTNVLRTTIELDVGANHEPNGFWFHKLLLMIQAINPADILKLKVTLDKDVIIPEGVKRSIAPPIRGPKRVMAEVNNPLTNVAGLIDTMLWISPRADSVLIIRENKISYVRLTHDEMLAAEGGSCCASYPTRCWRHTLVEYKLRQFEENFWLDLSCYFKGNLKRVGRHTIQRL